ncbi:MAG: glycosyltransferase family 4 protein [Candidatus Eisenbacteria bacterium]|nr:glycosyltransferase family 4 protein [Candidatus Eisenbacteria bacterium]
MRVLYLMDDMGGGTGNHVFSLVPRIEGVEPVFATTGRRVRTRLNVDDSTVYKVPPKGRFDPPVVHQARMLADLRRFALSARVDLIHSYFFWSIFFGRILKRMLGVPLVENREDLGFQWGTLEYALLRMGSGAPDRVICVAEAVRRQAARREGLPPARTTTVWNGIDPEELDADGGEGDLRAELGVPADAPVVGIVANFRRVKRVDRLIRAAPRLLDRLPDLRVLISGRGVEEERLRALVREMGLEERVLFAGFRRRLAPVYRAADITVLTSETEGCSIAVLESFHFGRPVVATDVGGNGELVRNGENGFLVPEWNEAAFADRVVRLLTDRALLERMGRAGRELVRERHGIDGVAREYGRIYEEVAAEGARHRKDPSVEK